MKKYYHISNNYTEKFTKKIPKYTLKDENKNIERVCLSTNICGCFASAPWVSDYYLKWYSKYKEKIYDIELPDIYIYEFDEELNLSLHDNIWDFNKIHNLSLVPDAYLNEECWYIGNLPLIPDKIYKIESNSLYLDFRCNGEGSVPYPRSYSYMLIYDRLEMEQLRKKLVNF